MVIHGAQKENWAQMWFLLQEGYKKCHFTSVASGQAVEGSEAGCREGCSPWPSVSAAQGMPGAPPGGVALWGHDCHSSGVPVAEELCGGSLLAASHRHGDCCRTASSLGIFFLPLNLWMHRVHEVSLSVLSVASLTRDILSLEKSLRNSHRFSWFFSIQHSQTLFQENKNYIFIYGGHAINISHIALRLYKKNIQVLAFASLLIMVNQERTSLGRKKITNYRDQKVSSVSTRERGRSANPVLNAGSVQGGMRSTVGFRVAQFSHRGIVHCIFHLYFQAVIIFSHLLFHRKGSLNFGLRKLNLRPTTASLYLFSLQSQSCLWVCKVEASACFMSTWQWKTWYNPLQQQPFVGFSLDKLRSGTSGFV